MGNHNTELADQLLEILACPTCKGEVVYDREGNRLICYTCKVYYEIIEGIPNMIPEEAKPLEESGQKNRKGEL